MIAFSKDSTKVLVTGLSATGLAQLKNSSPQDSLLYTLISVLQTPYGQDSFVREQPVKGTISVVDSLIVFTPERPFVKGKRYLVLTYLNGRFANAEAMMKGQMDHKLKPFQKLLSR